MEDRTGDPWGDEGFGGEDDWEGKESLESDLENGEDELEAEDDELAGEDELDDAL